MTCFLPVFSAAGGPVVLSLQVWCSDLITEEAVLDPAKVSKIRFPIVTDIMSEHLILTFPLSTCDLTVSPPSPLCQQCVDPLAQRKLGGSSCLSAEATGGECRVQVEQQKAG